MSGERLGAEAGPDLDAAALPDRVGDEVVRDRVVRTAIEGDAVGEHRRLHGVVVERVAGVGGLLRPHGQAVVAGVADEGVRHDPACDAGVEGDGVGDLVGDDGIGDPYVRHRPVEPHAHLGVVDVEAVDGRVAHRPADAGNLVGVYGFSDVALDREAGQVHVAAATVRDVPAVEADSGVHREVGSRGAQRNLVALDDGVPATSALDRDVVDDDVAVHLVRARRDVDLEVVPLGEGDRPVERVGGLAPAGRVRAERQHVRGHNFHVRRTDELGVEQVYDRPGGGAA